MPHKTGSFPAVIFQFPAITILIAVTVFILGQNAVWTLMEHIGGAAELSQDFIGFTLALILGISLSGSLAAAWMANRWGHVIPFVLFIIVQDTALWLFNNPATKFYNFSASSLYQFIWSFTVPYFMAVLVGVRYKWWPWRWGHCLALHWLRMSVLMIAIQVYSSLERYVAC